MNRRTPPRLRTGSRDEYADYGRTPPLTPPPRDNVGRGLATLLVVAMIVALVLTWN